MTFTLGWVKPLTDFITMYWTAHIQYFKPLTLFLCEMTVSPRLLYFPLNKIVHFCNCTKTNSLSSPLLFSKTATNQNWTLLRYHGATGNDSVLRSSTNSDVLYPHNLSIIISYLLWWRWLLRSTRVSFLILLYLLFFFFDFVNLLNLLLFLTALRKLLMLQR